MVQLMYGLFDAAVGRAIWKRTRGMDVEDVSSSSAFVRICQVVAQVRSSVQCLFPGLRERDKEWDPRLPEHIQAVQSFAKEQGRQVLIFNVKQGWGRLCDFLDKDQPDTPFPRLNDKAYFRSRTVLLHRLTLLGAVLGAVKVMLPGIIAAVASWYAWRHFNA